MTNTIGLVLSAVTAVGILLTGIGTVRNSRNLKEVHHAVKTANGDTIGEIIDKISDKQDAVKTALDETIIPAVMDPGE